jgi:hypothetical protein
MVLPQVRILDQEKASLKLERRYLIILGFICPCIAVALLKALLFLVLVLVVKREASF